MKTLDRNQAIAHLNSLIEAGDRISPIFDNANQHAKFVQQLERLIRLLEEEGTPEPTLAQISDFVFPGLKDSSRRTAFASFRTRLSKAASEIGHAFECVQPDLRGRDKHEIQCRFEGRPLPKEPEIRKTTERSTAGIHRFDQLITNPPFAAMKSSELEDVVKGQLPRDDKGRIPIRFFVSYARKDSNLVDRLLEKLQYDLAASGEFSFEFWQDTRIPLGEEWHDEIQSALKHCDIGLALISPGFLSSKYITDHELPALASGEKPLIPVAMKPIDFDRHDLHGLEARQIFRFEESGRFRAFSECRQGVADRYIQALARKIEERAKASVRLRGESSLIDAMGDPEKARELMDRFPEFRDLVNREIPPPSKKTMLNRRAPFPDHELHRMAERVFAKFPREAQIEPVVVAAGLKEVSRIVDVDPGFDTEENPYERFREHRRHAIDYLRGWLHDPDAAPFAAVLGEVGSGKTTMLQILAKAVGKDPEEPPVIFIDLRDYQGTKNLTLENILSEYLRRYDPERKLTAEDIVDAVQNRNALVIFDGLDEKIISMSEGERHGFIRELWRILPVEVMDRSAEEGRGRMIISCRSHYFPTVQSLNSGYVAQDRQGVRPQDYVACVMLPWEPEQIEEYLRLVLGEENVEAALETIASVHNLTDLSQRPYLLNLIAPELETLQFEQAAGRSVNAAALYEQFIERWLRRDEGKHVFTVEHKRILMEHLAADLWRDGAREWPWEQVADWLDRFLYDHPVIASRYQRDGVSTSTLTQDFRTATFFLRPDASDDGFRFAHTSLQEFFLASHIIRSFGKGVDEGIASVDLPKPSLETFLFIRQILLRVPWQRRENIFKHFVSMMEDRESPANSRRNGFDAYLLGAEEDDSFPNCRFLALNDLDLSEVKILGQKGNSIRLPKIDFSNSKILRSVFQHVVFQSETIVRNADLRSSEFVDCDLRDVDWTESELDGCFFRECQTPSSFRSFENRIRVQQCSDERSGPIFRRPAAAQLSAKFQIGFDSPIVKLRFSDDGAALISGSLDKTVRTWNFKLGYFQNTVAFYDGVIEKITFSPSLGKFALVTSPLKVDVEKEIVLGVPSDSQKASGFECDRQGVKHFEFSEDESALAALSWNGSLACWDLKRSQFRFRTEPGERVFSAITLSSSSQTLAASTSVGSIALIDTETFNIRNVFETPFKRISRLAYTKDGSSLLIGTELGEVGLIAVESGSISKLRGDHPATVIEFEFSDNSPLFLSSDAKGNVFVWNLEKREKISKFSVYPRLFGAMAVSSDGRFAATGSGGGELRIWDLSNSTCVRSILGARMQCKSAKIDTEKSEIRFLSWNDIRGAIPLPSVEKFSRNQIKKVHSEEKAQNGWRLSGAGNMILNASFKGILVASVMPLRDGNAIVLHPWNDEEARKPAHECRWKLVSGPEDAWRYVSAIDRETGESYGPEYCTENGTWEIT